MAVISVNETYDGRTGSFTFQRQRTYTRSYRVITDDPLDGPLPVIFHPEIPRVGRPYRLPDSLDRAARVTSVTPYQDPADPTVWTVTVQYDSNFAGAGGGPGEGGGDPEERQENPLLRPVEWTTSFIEVKRPLERDFDGKLIANSAGAPFVPPLEISRWLLQLNATKNFASYPLARQRQYQDHTNADTWMGCNPETALVQGLSVASAFENDIAFVRVSFNIVIDEEGWNNTRVLDKGPYYLDNTGKHRTFIDVVGNPVAEGLLDGTGKRGDPNNPVYLRFRLKKTADFSRLFT